MYICSQKHVLKYILFGIVISLGHYCLPKKNKWILLCILYFSYLMMAYYDHYFNCERNLGPTYLAMFYDWIKPQDSKQIIMYKHWCENHKNNVVMIDKIVLSIVFLFGPTFIKWNP